MVTYLANTDGRRKRTSGGSACSTPSKAPTARTCPSSASPAGPTHPPPHHRPPGLLSGAPRLPDRHLPPGASCLPWDFGRVWSVCFIWLVCLLVDSGGGDQSGQRAHQVRHSGMSWSLTALGFVCLLA